MAMPALDCPSPASAPVAAVFLNFRSQIVRPSVSPSSVGTARAIPSTPFEDRDAFEHQRATAERHFVHVHELSAKEAAEWIAAGCKAVLHEVSVAGVAAFESLKLAPAEAGRRPP